MLKMYAHLLHMLRSVKIHIIVIDIKRMGYNISLCIKHIKISY